MTLSIEHVAVAGMAAVEGLNREVELISILYSGLDGFGFYIFGLVGVEEVILFLLDPMVNRNHGFIIWKEANGDQRLVEALDWFWFIIEIKELCNIEIVNNPLGFAIYEQHRKITVILIAYTIDLAIISLLN